MTVRPEDIVIADELRKLKERVTKLEESLALVVDTEEIEPEEEEDVLRTLEHEFIERSRKRGDM